jgi:hypothetical protein
MSKNRISKNKPNSLINKPPVPQSSYNSKIKFSYKDFCTTQCNWPGQTYSNWQDDNLLDKLMNKLTSISGLSFNEAKNQQIIREYGSFPPKDKTEFTHPRHVIEDASWAKFDIQGKVRVIGHILSDTFYIVFLDKNHLFWKSELKHT